MLLQTCIGKSTKDGSTSATHTGGQRRDEVVAEGVDKDGDGAHDGEDRHDDDRGADDLHPCRPAAIPAGRPLHHSPPPWQHGA